MWAERGTIQLSVSKFKSKYSNHSHQLKLTEVNDTTTQPFRVQGKYI